MVSIFTTWRAFDGIDQPRTSHRNPSWSRDELILALDLYMRSKGNPPGKTAPEIVELSAGGRKPAIGTYRASMQAC